MKGYILFIFLYMISSTYSFSQKEGNIWIFGDSAAIEINSGSPVPLIGTALYTSECSSTICDINGDLLFYAGPNILTGGWETGVFNKYNQLIQNSTGIYNNTSSSQGCVLFPYPSDTNLFYLVTHRADASVSDHKMYYSIIDKSTNNDSGAVTIKNALLSGIENMTEHLIVIRHGNGVYWWLLAHKSNSNDFFLYLIDSSGIQGPFIQSIGTSFNTWSFVGQMVLSPTGKRLVVVVNTDIIDLFDFDRCTGTISNWLPLETNSSTFINNHYYGASFSPNSNVLYVSKVDSGLFQYNLQAPNIAASRQLIWLIPDTFGLIGQHKLGPDDKIYISNQKNGVIPIFNFENMHLSVINSPDSLGAACNFQPYSFYLGGRRSFGGLPNIPDYTLGEIEGACVVSVGEVEDKIGIKVHPNPANETLNISGLESDKIYKIFLYDLTGRIVFEQIIIDSYVNMNRLQAGVYLYKIEDSDYSIASGRISIVK